MDGVVFVERTTDEKDLDLLNKLIEGEPAYEKWHVDLSGKDNFGSGFGNSYEKIEDDVLYIKVDDDIVSASPNDFVLISHRLTNPGLY